MKAELEQVAGKRNNKKDAVNFEDRVKNLTSAVALFELNSDQKSLGNVRQSCLNIVDRIKSLNIPGQIQGSQGCEVSDVAAKVVAANFDERIKRTQAACRADLSKMTFDDVFAYGRNCLSVANLGKSLTAGYQRQLDKIALEYSAQAHPFERNVNAITSYNKLAILAAALAVLIDFLVFLTGIFGARHAVGILASAARPRPYDKENAVRWALGSSTTLVGDEDEETLKAKVFLSFLEPMAEIKDGFMCQIRLDRVAPPYLEIVNSVLNSGPYFERADEEGVFLVSDTMYRHLTKTVYDFEEYRKYFRGSAASASTARYATLTHSPHAATAQHSPSELDIVRAIKNATNSPNRAYTREK